MKKLLIVFLMLAIAVSVFAQSQLSTIRGKTKDGKTIKVDYYKGSVEDYIDNVKYQLVDELQAKVNDLQTKIDAANKSIEALKKNQKDSNSNSNETLKTQIAQKETEIKSLNGQIHSLNGEIKSLGDRINKLNGQVLELDNKNKALTEAYKSLETTNKSLETTNKSLKTTNDALKQSNQSLEKQNKTLEDNSSRQASNETKVFEDKAAIVSENNMLRDSLSHLNASLLAANQRINEQIKDCEKQIAALGRDVKNMSKPAKTPIIGLSFALGPTFVSNTDLNELWAKDVRMGKNLYLYYGTPRLTESFPLSFEMGVGIRSFKTGAHFNACEKTFKNQTDADGHIFDALYSFSDVKESISLTYFDIPISICLGQPAKDRIVAYFKLGLTPSIKISSKLEGEGIYSLKGYYPQWGVTLENIEELGLAENLNYYNSTEIDIKSFNLWGNMAFGVYIPFGCLTKKQRVSNIVLKAGLKCDYSLMSLSSQNTVSSDMPFIPGKCNLLIGKPKVFIPMVEVGLIYTLK